MKNLLIAIMVLAATQSFSREGWTRKNGKSTLAPVPVATSTNTLYPILSDFDMWIPPGDGDISNTSGAWATDFEFKMSTNNMVTLDYWYDSRGWDNPDWMDIGIDNITDHGGRLFYMYSKAGVEPRRQYEKSLTDSLTGELATAGVTKARGVILYPSLDLGKGIDISGWLNPSNNQITCMYALVHPVWGIVVDVQTQQTIWKPTTIVGWTDTQPVSLLPH